ncbi:MAG TPA: hypothetical protein VER55_08785 [Ardenticatenaceae bacterium]|nr:hypothetical protein [Ardenticatenaceae bacterium]
MRGLRDLNVHGGLVLLALVGLLLAGCWPLAPRTRIGVDVEADVIVYFKTGTKQAQIDDFRDSVLSRPHPSGTGVMPIAGVDSFLSIRPVERHRAIAIDFARNATQEQREEVLSVIEAAPIVFRVLTDTVPSSVTTLDE